MNSEMRNYGSHNTLGKYGIFPGRSTYQENPTIPPMASASDFNSRRQKVLRPYILQDSTNCGAVQSRDEHGEARTHQWEAVPAREAKTSKQEGYWNTGDLEMWESKDHLEMCHKRKQECRNLGRGWSSSEQVKRPLGHKPKPSRCPLPLLYEPIYEEWEPLYRRGLPQWPSVSQHVDHRQVEACPFNKEQSKRNLWSHKEASKVSDHRLRGSSEIVTPLPPSSLGEKGYKDRPLKPPSYDMYLQMRIQTQQERKSAQFEKSQRGQVIDQQVKSFAEQKELPPSICQQPFSRERRYQGTGNLCGSNVPPSFQTSDYDQFDREKDRRHPPVSKLGPNLPTDYSWSTISDGRTWLEVGRNEKMDQVNQKRKYIDAKGFGEQLCASTSPSSWHAVDKDLCPREAPHFRQIGLPLYHTPGGSTKKNHKRSGLKHEGIKVQNPQAELETWPREKDVRNKMKGEVLRSKTGEVVFCLVSRANSCQSTQDAQSQTLPKVGKDLNVPSWINELEPNLLSQQDGNFYKWGSECKILKSANVEVVRDVDGVKGCVNANRLQSCLDWPKYTSIYDDSENPGALNMTCAPKADLHFMTGHRQELGSPRQLLSSVAGKELGSSRNPDILVSREAWRAQHRGAGNSLNALQVTEQETGAQRHLRNEVGQITLSPIGRCRLDCSTAWHLAQHAKASNLQWDAPRRVARANGAGVRRERKLPEWKEPACSALKTGQRVRQGAERQSPSQDGLFLIDASSAIVKVEYILSPEKERVRFSSPIQVEDSFEHAILPDSSKDSNWSAERQEFSETVKSSLRNIVSTSSCSSHYLSSTSSHCFAAHVSDSKVLEVSGDPFPPPRMKERIKERTSRILGLPGIQPNTVRVQAREIEPEASELNEQNEAQTEGGPRDGDNTVDNSEEVQDSIAQETVKPAIAGSLPTPAAAQASSPPEVTCSEPQTGASAEKSDQPEIPQETSSSLPEGRGSSSGTEGDSGYTAPLEHASPNSSAEELHGKVLRSVLRLRHHTAPDSESDDEEQGRLLAPGVITAGRLAVGEAGDSICREPSPPATASPQRGANTEPVTHCWRDSSEALSPPESVVPPGGAPSPELCGQRSASERMQEELSEQA
ncbi:uncharacterized protein LOC125448206 [Stegostoma tigrinum]|uniref:uncharacterized protein LOC125448206 n=1 Tax=Stegostoma tigrinum TaxID=3053191 RepID=UPI0028702438|nr:uncharacterized protein LOC125448206 [Stegostoma tigrinum]